MNAISNITLTFARAGMEISWRYAWALYLVQLPGGKPPPLFGVVCVFVSAAALARLMAGKNWRLYQKVLLKFVCFSLWALLAVHQVLYQTFPLFSLDWMSPMLLGTLSMVQWFTLVFTVIGVYLIWQGGQTLVTGPRSYYPLCVRFDKGMGLFFLLLITVAFVESRTGFHLSGRDLIYLAIAFLMFSLTAMSIARNESSDEKSFLHGHHGIGIILSVSILIILLAAGTILFFYPYYSGLSDSLSALTKDAAGTMDTVLIGTLLYMLRAKKQNQQSAETTGDTQSLAISDSAPIATDLESATLEGGGGLFQSILGWSILSVIGVVVLVILGYLLFHLIRLLLRRSRHDTFEPLPAGLFSYFFIKFFTLPLLLWKSLFSLLRRADSAVLVFGQMLHWGKSSGIIMRQSETPSEYGARLEKVFPNFIEEIQQIVEGFNREVYGLTPADKEYLSRLRSAFGRMTSFKYWPMRIKVWFFK